MAEYSLVKRNENPRLVWASFTRQPTDLAIGLLQPGDIVKIGVSAGGKREFLWAIIDGRDEGVFDARVNNDLIHTDLHGLDDESPIKFVADNILQIYAG